ncbi:MAG: type VI secretion system tube protein Hcp [Anaerolineae bacterium]
MAVDMFLKLTGIDGESQDAKHKDEIEVLSYSFGVTNPGTMQRGGSGGGSSKSNVQDFTISKNLDKASPKLFLACASGQHIQNATLTVRKAGEARVEFLMIKLSDVLVSSYQHGVAQSTENAVDHVSFNFAKVEIDYSPQSATGAVSSPVTACWDIRENHSCG